MKFGIDLARTLMDIGYYSDTARENYSQLDERLRQSALEHGRGRLAHGGVRVRRQRRQLGQARPVRGAVLGRAHERVERARAARRLLLQQHRHRLALLLTRTTRIIIIYLLGNQINTSE